MTFLGWLMDKLKGDVPPMPHRIQLRRTRDWRMPPNAVKVDRSTRWGNPFRAGPEVSPEAATRLYEDWIYQRLSITDPTLFDQVGVPPTLDEIRRELRGRSLGCWCPIGAPCHANVLLSIANGTSVKETARHYHADAVLEAGNE